MTGPEDTHRDDPYPAEIMALIVQRIDDHQRRQTEQEAGMFWISLSDTSVVIVRRPGDDVHPTFYRVSIEPVRFEVNG